MGDEQAVAVLCKHIPSMVIAQFMPAVEAIADIVVMCEILHHRVEVFGAFGILKGKAHAFGAGKTGKLAEVRQTVRRGGMFFHADDGMQYGKLHAGVGGIGDARLERVDGLPAFGAVALPEFCHHAERRVDEGEGEAAFGGDFGAGEGLLPAHPFDEHAVEAGGGERVNLIGLGDDLPETEAGPEDEFTFLRHIFLNSFLCFLFFDRFFGTNGVYCG